MCEKGITFLKKGNIFQISPEADVGNFSKSLQKERTAIVSEILSRIHPAKLETEPWGEKNIFVFFLAKNQSLVFETQHLRIIFEVLDLHLGCLVLETHFPRTCFKSIDFYAVWEPAWYTKPDPDNQDNPPEMVHSWQFAP